jgi:hypothetical protein
MALLFGFHGVEILQELLFICCCITNGYDHGIFIHIN